MLDSLEWILDEITTFQKVELTQEQLIETERSRYYQKHRSFTFLNLTSSSLSRKLSRTANKIESGGQAIGKGFIKAANGLGSALRS